MSTRVTQVAKEMIIQDTGGATRTTQIAKEMIIQDNDGQLQIVGIGIEVQYQVGLQNDAILLQLED